MVLDFVGPDLEVDPEIHLIDLVEGGFIDLFGGAAQDQLVDDKTGNFVQRVLIS